MSVKRLLILLLLMCVPVTAAQPIQDAVLTGTLEFIDANTVVVSGQTVNISQAFLVQPLIVGATVQIRFQNVNGVLTTAAVEYPDWVLSRITGPVEQIGNGFITINGINFNTLHAVADGGVSIVVGQELTLEFAIVGTTAFAFEVSVPAQPVGGVELIGVLDAIANNQIVINRLAVDGSQTPLPTEMTTGMLVKSRLENRDGQLVATTLEIYQLNTASYQGTVTAADAATLIVDNLAFNITTAQIDSSDALVVGDRVKVDYQGQLVAVEVEDQSDTTRSGVENDEFKFYGVLENLSATTATVAGTVFDIQSTTVGQGLTTGNNVEVEFVTLGDDRVALEITTDSNVPGVVVTPEVDVTPDIVLTPDIVVTPEVVFTPEVEFTPEVDDNDDDDDRDDERDDDNDDDDDRDDDDNSGSGGDDDEDDNDDRDDNSGGGDEDDRDDDDDRDDN